MMSQQELELALAKLQTQIEAERAQLLRPPVTLAPRRTEAAPLSAAFYAAAARGTLRAGRTLGN